MATLSERLKIRPYARLLTMLGDQLIKNELIALVELIKNSYDADASWVKVSFIDFGPDYELTPTSKIRIEDDGCGMNADILRKHWLNPATPDKLKRKAKNPKTQKGRILQGEKGIGRFAIFKLGKKITITTRRQQQNSEGKFIESGENIENILTYDFSKYDNDFLQEDGEEKDLFLEQLTVELSQRIPSAIVDTDIVLGTTRRRRKPFGTIIEITDLKTRWTTDRINRIQQNIGKLQPIFSEKGTADFSVWVYKDSILHESNDSYKRVLDHCLKNMSVLKITNGRYICGKNTIFFDMNGQPIELSFKDPDIRGLTQFKRFKELEEKNEPVECGSFNFEFYIFDLNVDSENPSKYYLSKEEKSVIKEHRIYLYRDDVRVMPYGDPEDDWLRIDMARGTIRADEYLSNDQVVGCVYISQAENPNLKDKTNREGLIEEGRALEDFIGVLQLILRYLRKKPFAQYLIDKQRRNEIDRIKRGRPAELIEAAKKQYGDDEKAMAFLKSFESSYAKEKRTFEDRIQKTENLAAVGLSIETASHDVMLLLGKAVEQQETLIKELMLDSIESQQEFGNFVTRSLINRIQNYSFDEASIRSDTRPNTAELRKVVEGERYLSYAEQPAQAYTGDLFKNGSKYYLNIRAQCSLAREGDPLLYCIHGEKLKSKDIISEDIRLTTEKELVFSAKQHFSLDQMREICQDTEKLEVFNRNFSRHRNSIFFRKGTILERDDKVIIGCVAGEQAIQFKMDLEILSFNAWKGKRIGRVLPPYITKIQQKCAVNMVREGVAPLPKELFISFED